MTDDDLRRLRDHNASPLNPLPPVVWLLLLAIFGVEAVISAGAYGLAGGPQGVGWRLMAIERWGYSTALQHWMLDAWRFPARELARFFSYGFIHGSMQHAVFGLVLVAALGKMVGERFGTLGFLVLALVVPALAAVVFGFAIGEDDLGWLFGAMPMAFALVGGFTWLRWRDAAGDRARQRRAFSMIALLMGARLAFGLIAETGPQWIAELAAFALGFAASALVLGPGSWQRLRARIRG